MAEAKILLVDDDPDFVEATKIVLEAHGHQVLSAGDGESGLKKAKEERPDLMLLDVMMTTDSEGFAVAREIRETPELSDMAVLVTTGIREAKDLAFGFEPEETWLPVEGVLEKPVEPKQLVEEIAKATAKREP